MPCGRLLVVQAFQRSDQVWRKRSCWRGERAGGQLIEKQVVREVVGDGREGVTKNSIRSAMEL